MRLFDAHNHLQDDRFAGRRAELVSAARAAGVSRMVVNGACESDWPQVAELARQFPDIVIPSFGCHPWYLGERTLHWRDALVQFLDANPGSAVGEIGLDRWKPGLPYEAQEEVFIAQLTMTAERNVAASIHCLQAWGRMHDLLRAGPRPACGFLLHSYGGPAEMVAPLAKLGAHFSFPGWFLHERKARQRETFRHVPPDRLLIETDAPDQLPPETGNPEREARNEFHPLTDPATGKAINHPANLGLVYSGLAEFLGETMEKLSLRVEENFRRLFGFAERGDGNHPTN